MIEIPTGLPHEVVPLSWLIGVWEGNGMVEYKVGDEIREHPFSQRVEFRQIDGPYLEYRSNIELVATEDAEVPLPASLTGESGYWRLARPRTAGDVGPGLLPPTEPTTLDSVDAVEALRNDEGGFDLEVVLAHPTGVAEQYYGMIRGPRIDLATDGVIRTAGAEEYQSATRMYGLVQGQMFWAWDMAALGQDLRTHASGVLHPVAEATTDERAAAATAADSEASGTASASDEASAVSGTDATGTADAAGSEPSGSASASDEASAVSEADAAASAADPDAADAGEHE